MANYYAVARSNYVRIDDMDGLTEALSPFDITISEKTPESGLYCLLCDEGWPSFGFDEDDKEVEFEPFVHIMPFVKEGEVFITMEVGHEKLNYLVGYATAYIRKGDEVFTHIISLDDIYSRAADEFGVVGYSITAVSY